MNSEIFTKHQILSVKTWRKNMAKKMTNLEDLLVDQLKDLYSAEKQLVKALPKMAKAAHSKDLKKGFEEHLEQTKKQAERIEQIFESQGLNGSPKGKKCIGMEGLIKEGEEVMKEDMEADVLDAGLIAAAQKVEHYEIASYGTARTYAQTLGYNQAARMLQQTLDEEARTNEKLTALAESHINPDAAR
jgi:ferritin-like metal-binding protein YciE